jgi:hypothetical protein
MLTQIRVKSVWNNVIRIQLANFGILAQITSVDYVLMKEVVWLNRLVAHTDENTASLVSIY